MITFQILLSSSLFILSLIDIASCAGGDPVISSYSRDGFGRNDPNKLLNGFFPVWGIILLCLAGNNNCFFFTSKFHTIYFNDILLHSMYLGIFLLISIVSFVLYTLGCRPPQAEFKKVTSVA
jgi:hypothetical protein